MQGQVPVLISLKEDSKMVLASTISLWENNLPKVSRASVCVSRVSSSGLLPFWKALQDQQVCLTQTPFKLLLLPWVSEGM